MLTVGVAEEFLLLGPDGAVVPSAPFVARQARDEDRIRPGFLAYQLVTDTAGCGSLHELRGELSRLRLQAADAARRAGVSLVSVGAPPFAAGPLGAVTDETRYRELAGWFPDAVVAGRGCTCQVRIEVTDRDQAVDVLARIRPWLPALLALTVNSPFADGLDTGWASYRYHLQQHWPTFRPPGAWDGADRYDSVVRSLIHSGAAPDESTVFFLARVPAGQPVVEVRVADACLTVEDSVVFAGIVRALVRSLITDARRNLTTTPVPTSVVDAHLNTAAHGEVRLRQDRLTPTMPAAHEAVVRLMRKIGPALSANGDVDDVYRGFKRLRQQGTGADRQRRARRRRKGTTDFVQFLAGSTAAGTAEG
ncbi:glutamate-cysteine ligase family protein [Actinoplanes sp. NPDC048967]|uniref:carboxylate-amine ligase n=1 Tax=Actinoplanes sp. NPDC048967 TaxID=3155269 RepID=UPI0033E7939A